MIWKLVFHNLYEVSEDGQVKLAVDRGTRRKGLVLKQSISGNGYPFVKLSGPRGKRISISVSRLVAIAFLGEPPGKLYEADHKDDNPLHNHYTNLQWLTKAENLEKRFKGSEECVLVS